MKKLFSLITLLVLAIGLTGCTTETNELQQEITSLQQQIATLEAEKLALEEAAEDNEDLQAQIDALEQQLEDMLVSSHMNIITIELTDINGETESSYVTYTGSDVTIPLLDALQEAFDVDYMDTQYGTMINSINHMLVPVGSYIAIYENGVMSPVGIDDIVVDDGDKFEFVVSWWDMTQEAVYNALTLFMENQLEDYLSTSYIDYNVLLGCVDLCDGYAAYEAIHQDSVLETYLNGLTNATVQDYFKAIMIANQMTTTTTSDALISELAAVATAGPYGQTALGLIALTSYEHTTMFLSFATEAYTYYSNNTPYDEGLDAGGMSLVAFSRFGTVEQFDTVIDQYVNWIIAEQLPSGGVKTRDITWGDTVYPGTENAASISQVILALVANGYDPSAGDFVEGDTSLLLRLLDFQLEDGSFDWDLTDEVLNDKAFSTPQAFLALASYYQFINSYGEDNNPYIR